MAKEELLDVVSTTLTPLPRRPFVVACVPAFNEEKGVAAVVLESLKYVDEVVVVDDGSTDHTGEIAQKMGATLLRHERNRGYGAALKTGFDYVLELNPDIVVTLDADGQHDPSEIPLLVNRMLRGDVDLVIGSRFVGGNGLEVPGWRRAGIKLLSGLVSKDKLSVSDAQSGFRAYSKHALETLSLSESGMGMSTEILVKAGTMV